MRQTNEKVVMTSNKLGLLNYCNIMPYISIYIYIHNKTIYNTILGASQTSSLLFIVDLVFFVSLVGLQPLGL